MRKEIERENMRDEGRERGSKRDVVSVCERERETEREREKERDVSQ